MAVAPLPVMVDDDGSQSVETLCAKARKWRRDPAVFADPQHMGLVVVDYVQLIPPSRHGKSQLNRDQQVTEIFRQLKALAKEIRCPLLLVVSLSRLLRIEKINDIRYGAAANYSSSNQTSRLRALR